MPPMTRSVIPVFVVALCSTSSALAQPAADLFNVVRESPLVLDVGQLASSRGDVLRGADASVSLTGLERTFEISLSETEETRSGYTLSGSLVGDPLSTAVLVVNGPSVTGVLLTSRGDFQIGTVNGEYVIR